MLTSVSISDCVCLLCVLCVFVRIFQVALSVAAEFWEQGDLERTVLEQQPIVSAQISAVKTVGVFSSSSISENSGINHNVVSGLTKSQKCLI